MNKSVLAGGRAVAPAAINPATSTVAAWRTIGLVIIVLALVLLPWPAAQYYHIPHFLQSCP